MNRKARRAFTLIEMTVAATLLGVLLAALGQFLSRWEAARRAASERTFALRSLENVLEQTSVGTAEPADLLAELHIESRLNAPQLELTRGAPDDLGLVPITVSLSWQNAQGQWVSPVTLTTWQPPPGPRLQEAAP